MDNDALEKHMKWLMMHIRDDVVGKHVSIRHFIGWHNSIKHSIYNEALRRTPLPGTVGETGNSVTFQGPSI